MFKKVEEVMSGGKKTGKTSADDGGDVGRRGVEDEEEEELDAGEEDRLLIQHLRPTVHPSHKDYKNPPIELRNHSESSLSDVAVDDIVAEHSELRDQHMNPDTVLLDLDNDSIPIDLTFFKIGSLLSFTQRSFSRPSFNILQDSTHHLQSIKIQSINPITSTTHRLHFVFIRLTFKRTRAPTRCVSIEQKVITIQTRTDRSSVYICHRHRHLHRHLHRRRIAVV